MRISLLLLLLAGSAAAIGAEVRYVTDQLSLPVRSGQTTSHKIVQMVRSGQALEVLQTRTDGYTEVRTDLGRKGWILSRYLMDQPAARERVDQAEALAARLQGENDRLTAELTALRESSTVTERRNADLSLRERELSAQLQEIRRTAGGALQLADENKAFKRELLQKEKDIQALTQQAATLGKRTDQQWFMIGAIVVLVSIFLGHLLPRMRLRKGSNLDRF